jgi:hypothetical protein
MIWVINEARSLGGLGGNTMNISNGYLLTVPLEEYQGEGEMER